MASGTGHLNPLPPNFEPYQPLEFNLNPSSPFSASGPVLPGCAAPGIGRYFPLPPEAFDLSASFALGGFNPPQNPDFIPPRDFLGESARILPPPTPSAATNIDDFYRALPSDLDGGGLQMPVDQGNFQALGGASHNFGFSGFSSIGPSVDVCPFVPPRANRQDNNNNNHYHHDHNLTPTPRPSNRVGVNSNFSIDPFRSPSSHPSIQPNVNPAVSGCTHELNSDNYFVALLSGDFSSPSLPALSTSSPIRADNSLSPPYSTTTKPSSTSQNIHNMPPRREPASMNVTAASTRSRRRSSVTSTVDLTSPKLERDGESPSDPAAPMPPPSRKRTRASTTTSSTQQASSRPPSTSTRARPVKNLPPKRRLSKQEDDVFCDSSSVVGPEEGDGDVLDLTGADEVPAELLKPKVDNRIKLSKFQCSICMDNATGLTVTHCGMSAQLEFFMPPLYTNSPTTGHMFCSECLHSALHIDHMKRTCPICRQKVEVKAKAGQKQPKNTFYHLELKLMTANRKGKRPIGR
jgi:hypothetical protein